MRKSQIADAKIAANDLSSLPIINFRDLVFQVQVFAFILSIRFFSAHDVKVAPCIAIPNEIFRAQSHES